MSHLRRERKSTPERRVETCSELGRGDDRWACLLIGRRESRQDESQNSDHGELLHGGNRNGRPARSRRGARSHALPRRYRNSSAPATPGRSRMRRLREFGFRMELEPEPDHRHDGPNRRQPLGGVRSAHALPRDRVSDGVRPIVKQVSSGAAKRRTKSSPRGTADRGACVVGKLDDLADDELRWVGDQVAVEVEDLAGAARVPQRIACDGPQRVVRPHLVDGPGGGGCCRAPGAGDGPNLGALSSSWSSDEPRSSRRLAPREGRRPCEGVGGAGRSRSGSVWRTAPGEIPSDEPGARFGRAPSAPGAGLRAARNNVRSSSLMSGTMITSPT